MNIAFERPTLRQRLKPWFAGFDGPLTLAVLVLASAGALTVYSAGFDFPGRIESHLRNLAIAAAIMFVVAQIPPHRLMTFAVPVYTIGVALLVAVALFGITKKGAQRWVNIGIVIQPSEILKIGVPLMLAWWFQRREGQLRVFDFGVALVLLALPVALIVKQPDLGTAILVASAGLYVIFFAGVPIRLVVALVLVGAIGAGALIASESRICQPDVDWPVLREYQKDRVCTLLDPAKDPLGRGFHTIQSTIAIGSGGVMGKGYMAGTQTHLEFIPERTTDFIFAVYSEEFGLFGNLILLGAFLLLILRGLMIAGDAPTTFARLLAGGVTLSFFTYAFVNMGMVSGLLPVVGVPLPFLSYGGTAMVTLGLGLGILMSIAKSKRLVQT